MKHSYMSVTNAERRLAGPPSSLCGPAFACISPIILVPSVMTGEVPATLRVASVRPHGVGAQPAQTR